MILTEEINRIKKMMGLNLLNEGWDDIFKKLFGVSDETVTVISKEFGDDPGKYSSKLASIVGGTGSISDVTTYLSRQGTGTSDEAIVAWIKTQPEIIDQIARNSDEVMKKASKIVYGKLQLSEFLTPNALDVINTTLLIKLEEDSVDVIIKYIDKCLDVLTKLPQRGNNSDLDTLIKQLEDKKRLSENYKSSMSSSPVVKTTDEFTPSPTAKSYLETFAYNNSNSFIQMATGKPMSGWKIHIYGDSVEDSAKLITKLDDYLKSTESFYKIATDKFYKNSSGTKQQGKALTIYIPYDVVKSGKQKEYFDGISQKLGNYNKTGDISGDKSYNGVIHYRYEYKEPFDTLPEGGVTIGDAGKYYESNEGDYMSGTGDKQPDLFNRSSTTDSPIVKQTTDFLSGKRISNRSFNESDIDWANITNAKSVDDYNKIIANAIQTGDYSRVSRSGFERYGIDNFREYLMNNISKVNEVDPSIGRWSVNFK
jgi:hypothetical protein